MAGGTNAASTGASFAAEDGDHTRVDLRHRYLERYGDQGETMRAVFESPKGWTDTLTRFANAAGG